MNVARVLYDATLRDVRIYQFDDQYRLRVISQAREGRYVRENLWRLKDVVQTSFENSHISVARIAEKDWHSVLTPSILSVLLVPPEDVAVDAVFLRPPLA